MSYKGLRSRQRYYKKICSGAFPALLPVTTSGGTVTVIAQVSKFRNPVENAAKQLGESIERELKAGKVRHIAPEELKRPPEDLSPADALRARARILLRKYWALHPILREIHYRHCSHPKPLSDAEAKLIVGIATSERIAAKLDAVRRNPCHSSPKHSGGYSTPRPVEERSAKKR